MEINFNLGSLQIIHPTLNEYFKSIQANVQSNLVLIRDDKKVATNYEAIDLLGKVQGSLKMIGLSGLVKVLQLCQESLKNVKEVKFDTAKNVKILEACDHTLKNIELYLQNLLAGELNQPTKFFTEYSELATLVGKDVSILDLFSPRLDFKEEVVETLQNELKQGKVMDSSTKESVLKVLIENQAIIKKQNAILIKSLENNGEFSNAEEKSAYHESCKELYQALNQIHNLKLSKHVYILTGLQKLFVCTTSPIFNDEVAKLFNLGNDTITKAFTLIEDSISSWKSDVEEMGENDKTGTIKVDEEVAKQVLYILINVLKENKKLQEMPAYKEIAAYFDFNFYNNQLKNSGLVSTIFQRNPEVAEQIEKILLDIKEELTLVTSKQASSEEFLSQHAGKFINLNQKLNDTLVAVDTKDMGGLLNALNAIFTKIKNKEFQFNELLQREVSLTVILLEYGINTFVKSIVKEEDRNNFAGQVSLQQKRLLFAATNKDQELSQLPLPELDEKNKKQDERKAFVKMFQELSKDFVKAESILDQFLKNPEDGIDEIKEVFQCLKAARGIFSIIGKPELGKVVAEIIKVWESIVQSGVESVDKELLHHSISWVSGVSLIINASKDDNETESEELARTLISKFNQYFKKDNNTVVASTPSLEQNTIVDTIVPVVTESKPVTVVSTSTNKAANSGYIDEPNDADLLEVYIMEADEVLENMQTAFKVLEKNNNDKESITDLRRHFHTLKGSGKMVGLKYLGEAGWIVEQTLNRVLSDELSFNDTLFNAIKFADSQFHMWVESLKANNNANVDLVNFKKNFEVCNPNISTTFEITESVAEVETPIVVEEDKEDNDVVVVGGKEISSMLYNLFVEESATHVKGMQNFVKHKENKKGAVISSDFMLHAHTLASISRTVNLLDCANIASKLEIISNLSMEKHIAVTEEEMKVLASAVEHMEKYRSVINESNTDPVYISKMLSQLDLLQDNIHARSIPVETVAPVVKPVETVVTQLPVNAMPSFDIDVLVEKLAKVIPTKEQSEPVNATIDMDALVEALFVRLQPLVSQPSSAQTVDMETLTKNVVSALSNNINESIEKINSNITQSLNENISKMNESFKSSLEENVEKMKQIHNEFKSVLESNSKAVESTNEKFLTSLAENVSKAEAANEVLKSSLEMNVQSVNDELSSLLHMNVQKINDGLKESLETNLSEINNTLKTALDTSLEKVGIDVNEALSNNIASINNSIKDSVDSSLEQMKDLVNDVQSQLAEVKAMKLQVVDTEQVSSEVMNKVGSLVENQYKELSKVLTENKYNTKEIVNELFNKIEQSEHNISEFIEAQKAREIHSQELLNDLHGQFKTALEQPNTKKGFLQNLFGK